MKVLPLTMGGLLFPLISLPQEDPGSLSWGQRIDREFQPVADAWEAIVFYPVPVGDFQIPLFLIFVVIGASTTLNAVIKFSDAMILALVFPNMIGLFFLFPKVREELKNYLKATRGI